MSSLRSRLYTPQDLTTVEPIVRLWLLRLLVPLECHRKIIGKQGIHSEEIAELFALQTGSDEISDVGIPNSHRS